MAKPMTKTEWMNWVEEAWNKAQQSAWAEKGQEFECPRCGHCCQQREWVGLTKDEFDLLVPYCHNEFDWNDYKEFASAIEAKLKEKNT